MRTGFIKKEVRDIVDFGYLKKIGKTVIYKESQNKLRKGEWTLWGERITGDEHVFVYRKIVTFEEAEQYELEND